MEYTHLSVRCDLSIEGMKQAIKEGGLQPSSIYTLYVHVDDYYTGKHVAACAMEKDNPFSPYLNLIISSELRRNEWVLKDGVGNMAGSEGA